ncbi:MAG: tetratricopeptide repeat protein, partial [Alphaproteobacteria bacterium]|nr:tetratricopeptide repeat protein [Alphaproteobacteria bacterium]
MSSDGAIDAATAARRTALVGVLDPADAGGAAVVGMAAPAVLAAVGPDAAVFLHSQLTNDVSGVDPGAGNLSARVSRTGHLRALFTLHRRVDDPTAFRMVLPADDVGRLRDDLDAFLFADDVTLSVEPARTWIAVQGPKAADVMDAAFGPLGFEPWGTLPEHAHRDLRRGRAGLAVPAGTWVIRRSLTGDVGFLVALPPDAAPDVVAPVVDAVTAAATAAGCVVTDTTGFSAALEVLRIEAGIPRLGPESAGKERLLPETGVDQQAVSYTKGCYLGQEVIARVRTYGSVPHLLRAIVLPSAGDAAADAARLATLPPPGTPLVHAGDGKKAGTLASATWSPVAGAPVVLAYLGRADRTPGAQVDLQADGVAVAGTIALLPLYSAPDAAAQVQQLYDRAIRTFADGQAGRALALLEEALRLDPSFGDAYEAIGVMLGRSGHFHEAIDVFRRLEEVVPDEPMVNTNLSLYYMKLGDKQTAEDEAGKATLKSMARARGRSGAGATVDEDLEKGKRKDAARKKAMFARVLEIDAADPIALFGMGTALLTLGEHEEAARWLAQALEVDKNNSPVYAAAGRALERLERVDEAVAVYKAGVEVASRKGDLMP